MKILQVNYKMDIGGIESFLMNVYKNINRKHYEFIFLTYENHIFDFEDEIKKLNGKIIKISNPKNVSFFKHIKEIYDVIKECNIDVIHCHTYFDSAYVMIASKIAGVQVRIVHSHTTYGLDKVNIFKKIKWNISRYLINNLSTNRLACSTEAGRALFKNKSFKIIENGIELEKFNFDRKLRKIYRNEFKVNENQLIIGHIGRFDVPKNHKFLIDIFDEICKVNNNVKLILVGSGKLNKEIKHLVKEKKLEEQVLFLGNRNDVNKILNSFDVFVFPSLYEGLPVTLVEVQANGLVSIVSDNISKEIKLNENLEFLSLELSAVEWAKEILKCNKKRINNLKKLNSSVYNISNTVNKLQNIYKGELKNNEKSKYNCSNL